MDNSIRIGHSVSQLTGIGTEYLVINGTIIAKFYNGNFLTVVPSGNSEKTVTAA